MNNLEFWKFFNTEAAPQLAERESSLRYTFEFLDKLARPVFVVETGCVRKAGNWAGDGQSTVLFDKFVAGLPGSLVHTVDLDPEATAICKTLVSPAVNVHNFDSVPFLHRLAKNHTRDYFPHIDVLYLDSYDVDMAAPHPSAMHHMKELLAISPLIGPQTLVVVDDAPQEVNFVPREGGVAFVGQPRISGKGKYVAEYAENIGVKPVFTGYQAGWIGLY